MDILKKLLRWLTSFVAIILAALMCNFVCSHPSEDVENTVNSFYREPNNTLDFVVIGSSAANKDIYPAVFWQEQKITGYNYSIGACSGNIYSSVLREVLSTQKDALIIIDIDGFLVDDKFQNELDPIRIWLDSIPKNKNWIRSVKELDPENKTEHFFPFIRYHRNMTSIYEYARITASLTEKKLHNTRDAMKGATLNPNIDQVGGTRFFASDDLREPLTEKSDKVFKEFVEECNDVEDIRILFVNLPKKNAYEASVERNIQYSHRANTIKDYVKANNYDYLDLCSEESGLQLEDSDFTDTLHLSENGAIKFSSYFAKYLAENYEFSEKDDATAKSWDDDFEIYKTIVHQ